MTLEHSQRLLKCIWTGLMFMIFTSRHAMAQWRKGRATFYGNEPWYWSIHHGSCGYGYLWPDQGLGWDIVALADAHPDYQGSCGACYEVKCTTDSFKDGYGKTFNHNSACKDQGVSVVVRTTDTCPCDYPDNAYSNKRWCCGDMDHMDLSVFAFQKLSDMSHGVISIEYRKVDCGQQPEKQGCCADFPGEFPPLAQADSRPDFDYAKYFPNGGYLNSKAGDGSDKITVDEYKKRHKTTSSWTSPGTYKADTVSGSSQTQSGDTGSTEAGASLTPGSASGTESYAWAGWGDFFGRVFG